MQAVISGHAGVALLLDGPELSSVHVEDLEKVVPRRESEAYLLFGGAKDLQFLEDVSIEQVRSHLEFASARIDALHLALIVLDGDLTEETRREAAVELDTLLEIPAITYYLQCILYAHPLTPPADPLTAIGICFISESRAQALFEAVQAHQNVILEAHRAWEAIPSETFARPEERSSARALFATEGLFRTLVYARSTGNRLGSFREKIGQQSAGRIDSRILEAWLTYFDEQGQTSSETFSNRFKLRGTATGYRLAGEGWAKIHESLEQSLASPREVRRSKAN